MRYLIVALCLGAAACATPYQDMGLMGGVAAKRITDDTAQISVQGNGYTSPDLVEQYILRKAAEETIKDGFNYFEVISASDRTRSFVVTTPGTSYTTAQVSGYGNYATGSATTYRTPARTGAVTKPGESIMIKMHKGAKPSDAAPGVYDAEELLRYLVPPAKP